MASFPSDPLKNRWLKKSNIPLRFQSKSLYGLEKYEHNDEVIGAVKDWTEAVRAGHIIAAEHPAVGQGMLFYGEPGMGKTTLATSTLMDLLHNPPRFWYDERPRSPLYFSYYPEMLDLAKKSWNDDDYAPLVDALFGRGDDPVQILALDDLGKEHRTATGWAENFFDHLLRSRYDAGLPTIITSNVPPRQWETAYGKSMASFAHEALTPIAIIAPGGDRRLA